MNASQYLANHQFEFVKHFRTKSSERNVLLANCSDVFQKSVDPVIVVLVDIMTDLAVDDTSDDGVLRLRTVQDRQPKLHCFVYNMDEQFLTMEYEQRVAVMMKGVMDAIRRDHELSMEAHGHPLVILAAWPALPPPGYIGTEHLELPH